MNTKKTPGWVYVVVVFVVVGILGPLFEQGNGTMYMSTYEGMPVFFEGTEMSGFGAFVIILVIVVIIYFIKKSRN